MAHVVADASPPAPGSVPATGDSFAPPIAARYDTLTVLGRGAGSAVYRARDRLLGREVALKVLPAVSQSSAELLRHRSELQLLAGLRHPGLVTLLDGGVVPTDDDMVQAYLVMELVLGPSLARRLERGPLTLRDTARVGRAVAQALAHVHANDVIHRDVKPGNILLVDGECLDGTPADPQADEEVPPVKLADFGIARISASTRLTTTGTIVGTADYLSPEQAMGGTLATSSDVYALGVVLIECVTGHPPFSGTLAEVASARLWRDPEIPPELGPLADLVERMTDRLPEERPTASDVAAELSEWVCAPVLGWGRRAPTRSLRLPAPRPHESGELPVRRAVSSGDGTSPPSTKVRPPRRRARLVAAVLGAALLVGGGLAVQANLPDATTPEPPAYPAVDGPLGESLTRLQGSVEP